MKDEDIEFAVSESIEGNPFITRFKTLTKGFPFVSFYCGIEGNPFITRFKTITSLNIQDYKWKH